MGRFTTAECYMLEFERFEGKGVACLTGKTAGGESGRYELVSLVK